MKVKARVVFTRSSTGLVAVQTSMGTITVLDLLGRGHVQSGDIFSGEMEAPGTQEIYNETRDEDLAVFVRECGLNVQKAVERHFAQLAPVISNE